MSLILWCNRIIRFSFLLLVLLVPLILTPWNSELFEFNKMLLTYGLTIIILTAWMIKMSLTRSIYIRRSILDIPILLFVASQFISSLFSMDPHVSWFGYYSRFNGGVLSIFTYALLYFAFLSNYGEKADDSHYPAITPAFLKRFLMLLLGSAMMVSLYAVAQRLGIDKNIWVQDVQNRVFSTLGQPNWLAAYIVALIPSALILSLMQQSKKSIKTLLTSPRYLISVSLSCLFFVVLIFTKSRSGLIGLGGALTFLFIGLLVMRELKRTTLVALVLPFLMWILIVASFGTGIPQIDSLLTWQSWKNRLSTTNTSPTNTVQTEPTSSGTTLLEFGGTNSGILRKYVWEGAIAAWRSSPKVFFIGTGTETFAFAFFRYRPVGHNLTSEWDFLYNKAHNEYLNYLTTTGIAGLGSYLLLLGIFAIWFLKMVNQKIAKETLIATKQNQTTIVIDKHQNQLLALALFSGWISILITNFFGFSVVIIQILLFLLPAMIILLLQKDSRKIHLNFNHLPKQVSSGIGFTAMLIAVICLGYVGMYWIADYNYETGRRQSRQGLLAEAYRSLSQALLLRPSEPLYYDELGVTLSALSVASMEAGDATTSAELARQSLTASDKSLAISPNNVNFWKSRTKIYFGFSSVDDRFTTAAIESLEKALSLSPLDPKITYNLAVLYGKLNQNEKSIELLKQTIAMKPNYRDAYFALYVFYLEVKQPNLATAILQEYLNKVDPNDKDFQQRLTTPTPPIQP
jgi:O-antigen ligase/Flp pilus assembly protein TadD